MSASFPGFLPNLIAKFVNASTVDGFNPYRVTRDGVDWEEADPEDPWSHIGYWGDHQIVYLLQFIEALERYSPGALADMLPREIHCYAEVPYRLKRYEQIVADLLVESPLVRPSVMAPTAWLRELGGYREFDGPEDYELWLRAARQGASFAKLPRPLLVWRDGPWRLTRASPRYAPERFRQLKLEARSPVR